MALLSCRYFFKYPVRTAHFKQSKWNFIVSVFVEITEILICVVLSYRFATMASTLFFWLPIDIISFINWNKHPDKVDDELTRVRKLSGKTEALILAGIVVWTLGVGYFLTTLEIGTDLFGGNEVLENIVCYLDACASRSRPLQTACLFSCATVSSGLPGT